MSKINEKPTGVEFKINIDGSENPKYVDLLDEDKPVAGQKFVCLSFISPEKTLKQKEMFYFEHFLKNWDFKKSIEKFAQFLNFVSFKYNLDYDKVMEDFKSFTKEEKANILNSTIEDDYKNFLDEQETQLDNAFGELHGFQTCNTWNKSSWLFSHSARSRIAL